MDFGFGIILKRHDWMHFFSSISFADKSSPPKIPELNRATPNELILLLALKNEKRLVREGELI